MGTRTIYHSLGTLYFTISFPLCSFHVTQIMPHQFLSFLFQASSLECQILQADVREDEMNEWTKLNAALALYSYVEKIEHMMI